MNPIFFSQIEFKEGGTKQAWQEHDVKVCLRAPRGGLAQQREAATLRTEK